MNLSSPTLSAVAYVAERMRAADREEIFALRWEDDASEIAHQVMAVPEFAWVAWHDGLPCAVIGGFEKWPGTWSIFMFATDAFPAVGLRFTKFVRQHFIPTLFRDLGARRLQAESHSGHSWAHRWLKLCGAVCEGTLCGYGKDGCDYLQFAIVASANSTN